MNNHSTQNHKNTELDQSAFSFKHNSDPEPEVILPRSSLTTKPQKTIRVLIAEDQYTCQQIWRSYLEPEPDLEIIGTAIDGQEAIELVEKLKPDVVLMDINMPRMDGLTATEIITNRYVDTKILILSVSDRDRDIKKSLQIGATGYLLKSTHPQELVTAIRSIYKGYCQLGPGLIEKLNLDTSPVPKQQFDHAFSGDSPLGVGENSPEEMDLDSRMGTKELLNESEKINVEQADETSSNSVVVLPQRKTKKLVALNFRLPLLLLSGLLVFLLTPSGRNWWSKLPILSTLQPERAATAQDSSSTTILPVETVKVNLVDSYQVDRTYIGTIVSRRSSSLGFERGGKLLNLTVDLGEQVEVGAPLAVLDTKNLKAKQQELLAERKQVKAQLQELLAGSRSETIAAAKSTVKSIQSQLKLAQTKGQRRQELHTSGAISREQLDEATTEVNTLQARLNEAQSQLDELLAGTRPEKIAAQQALLEQLDAKLASLELELEQSTLKAPFTGRVAKRLVDEGTVVSAGESIFTLVEASNLEVHVGVPVNTASQIPLGSKQQLKIGSRIYQAQVLSTLPQLDSATRTLTVVLGLDESAASEVRAGQVARLKLSENIADSGYWLPTTALVRGVRGLWSCYVLGDSENVANNPNKAFRVEQQEVEVLQTQSDRVFVRGTLQNNDRVIINGNHRLVPGQLVRPIEHLQE
ncbi:MAG: efflux RND transporter periplasmic adaptor subunit [Pleurocapsa sp. MO_226.B13]|nr:efflux RND transporter periplasmic adaptor subunit [Pleurocapsa sp. MO_226.B13]